MKAVHPRVCGEHDLPPPADNGLAGSSPRVRGTRVAASQAQGGVRFIPACAGNT